MTGSRRYYHQVSVSTKTMETLPINTDPPEDRLFLRSEGEITVVESGWMVIEDGPDDVMT